MKSTDDRSGAMAVSIMVVALMGADMALAGQRLGAFEISRELSGITLDGVYFDGLRKVARARRERQQEDDRRAQS